MNKKGNTTLTIIIIVLILLWITSTQKIEVNNTQISTATPQSCALIQKSYDSVNKVCINANQTIQGQEGSI